MKSNKNGNELYDKISLLRFSSKEQNEKHRTKAGTVPTISRVSSSEVSNCRINEPGSVTQAICSPGHRKELTKGTPVVPETDSEILKTENRKEDHEPAKRQTACVTMQITMGILKPPCVPSLDQPEGNQEIHHRGQKKGGGRIIAPPPYSGNSQSASPAWSVEGCTRSRVFCRGLRM